MIYIGMKVSFQFNDDGVARDGVGTLVNKTSGGMYVCQFKDSNITVECVPNAVRPANFSLTSLQNRIRSYGTARVAFENRGGNHPDDVPAICRDFYEARSALYSYVEWL